MEETILTTLEEIKCYTMLSAKSMLTVKDMELYTGLKASNIRKMAEDGRLPYYRPFGKQLYFKKSEIDSILQDEENRIPSIAELYNEKINRNGKKC